MYFVPSFDKAESFTAITKGGLTELLQKIRNVSAQEKLLLRQSLSWIIFHLKYLVFFLFAINLHHHGAWIEN